MEKRLKLQRSETFYIREGWIEKVFMAYTEKAKGAFSSKSGTGVFGIGSNMIKSLRYWGEACCLIDSFSEPFQLSEDGKLLIENDPYMESLFSWELLHYWLVTNKEDAPVFYAFFNNLNWNSISRRDSVSDFESYFIEDGFVDINILSLQKDIATLISSYFNDDDEDKTPEENISCPLARLGLLSKKDSDFYEKKHIKYSNIDYRLLYICLRRWCKEKKSFNIDDAMTEEESPVVCFNMGRDVFLMLLTDMKKNGLITLNRTAGLNVAYLDSAKTDDDLFKDYIYMKNKVGGFFDEKIQ